MNDIADKIWAAIQRPSPPVTKDEIVALVNEGLLPFEVETDAEQADRVAHMLPLLPAEITGIGDQGMLDTIFEKVWYSDGAMQRSRIPLAEYQRDFAAEPAELTEQAWWEALQRLTLQLRAEILAKPARYVHIQLP